MNRRGVGFSIAVAFLVLIVLTAAFKIIHDKEKDQAEIRIGEREASLISAYQEAERELFYLDMAADIAAPRAVYTMTDNGGQMESPCGEYLGYNLWNSLDGGRCYPVAETEYQILFQEEFAKLQTLHPFTYEIKIASITDDNQVIFEVIGIPSANIEVAID